MGIRRITSLRLTIPKLEAVAIGDNHGVVANREDGLKPNTLLSNKPNLLGFSGLPAVTNGVDVWLTVTQITTEAMENYAKSSKVQLLLAISY